MSHIVDEPCFASCGHAGEDAVAHPVAALRVLRPTEPSAAPRLGTPPRLHTVRGPPPVSKLRRGRGHKSERVETLPGTLAARRIYCVFAWFSNKDDYENIRGNMQNQWKTCEYKTI